MSGGKQAPPGSIFGGRGAELVVMLRWLCQPHARRLRVRPSRVRPRGVLDARSLAVVSTVIGPRVSLLTGCWKPQPVRSSTPPPRISSCCVDRYLSARYLRVLDSRRYVRSLGHLADAQRALAWAASGTGSAREAVSQSGLVSTPHPSLLLWNSLPRHFRLLSFSFVSAACMHI